MVLMAAKKCMRFPLVKKSDTLRLIPAETRIISRTGKYPDPSNDEYKDMFSKLTLKYTSGVSKPNRELQRHGVEAMVEDQNSEDGDSTAQREKNQSAVVSMTKNSIDPLVYKPEEQISMFSEHYSNGSSDVHNPNEELLSHVIEGVEEVQLSEDVDSLFTELEKSPSTRNQPDVCPTATEPETNDEPTSSNQVKDNSNQKPLWLLYRDYLRTPKMFSEEYADSYFYKIRSSNRTSEEFSTRSLYKLPYVYKPKNPDLTSGRRVEKFERRRPWDLYIPDKPVTLKYSKGKITHIKFKDKLEMMNFKG